MTRRAIRILVLAVAAVLVVAGAAFLVLGNPTRSVTAHFDRAVGLYKGSDVRMLGVKIGTITSVHPRGDEVVVRLRYEKKVKVPANAVAVIVPPSLVSDRYVQLAPAYTSGRVLADKADIPRSRTASPVELDDIYSALNTLNVALGPNGTNKKGALSDLTKVAAANLNGNGAALGQSIQALSKAALTLADGRTDLFGTVKNLQAFTAALTASDTQVRAFNDRLATIAKQLADERQSLGLALANLSTALRDVATFIRENGSTLHTSIVGLKTVTGVLAKQKDAINEILSAAPVALSNLGHAYDGAEGAKVPPGTLDVRANFADLGDPAVICGLLNGLGKLGKNGVLDLVGNTVDRVCSGLAKQLGCLINPLLPGGDPTGGLLLPSCKENQSPGLPGLPKIPGLPVLGGNQ